LLELRIPDFNNVICSAIDDTVREVLGERILHDMYETLGNQYGIGRDELPYRNDTMYQVLETKYSVPGANTMAPLIAEKLYAKLGLTFYVIEGYALRDYIRDAELKITKATAHR